MSIKMKNAICALIVCFAAGCKIPDKGLIDTSTPPFISQANIAPNVIDVTRLGLNQIVQ